MPGARRGLPYGASYDRRLFEEHGYFREDLRVGEDNEFNRRLPTRPKWNKRILTLHRNPTRLFPLIADQYRRGERAACFEHRSADMEDSVHPIPRSGKDCRGAFRLCTGGVSALSRLPP